MPPPLIYSGDDSEPVLTQSRKVPANLLRQIDVNVIITSPEARKTTRQAVNGRSFALYDQRYHPMDDYLRRGRAKGATKAAARKRSRSPTPEDSDGVPEDQDAETASDVEERNESSAPTRKSSRIASQTTRPLYSVKIHPQDEELKKLVTQNRRSEPKPDRRSKKSRVVDSSDSEDNPDDVQENRIPEGSVHYLGSQSSDQDDMEDGSSRCVTPHLQTYQRSTPAAMSPVSTERLKLQPPDQDEVLFSRLSSPQIHLYQRSNPEMSPGNVIPNAVHIRESNPAKGHSTQLDGPLESNQEHFAREAVRLVSAVDMLETELTISRSPTSYFEDEVQYHGGDMINEAADPDDRWAEGLVFQLDGDTIFGSSGFTAINKAPC
jgi:hypothetical protein